MWYAASLCTLLLYTSIYSFAMGVTVAHVQQGRFKTGAPICVLIAAAHSVWVGLSGPQSGDSRGDGLLDWPWAEKGVPCAAVGVAVEHV